MANKILDQSKSKAYFFKINQVETKGIETGHKWELKKLKLREEPGIVTMIFSGILEKIDEYETNPNHIQTEIVNLSDLGRSFQISFTKSSDTRVNGFIREFHFKKEEIHYRVLQLMERDPEFTKYLLGYFL